MSSAWLGDASDEETDKSFQVNQEFAARLEVSLEATDYIQQASISESVRLDLISRKVGDRQSSECLKD